MVSEPAGRIENRMPSWGRHKVRAAEPRKQVVGAKRPERLEAPVHFWNLERAMGIEPLNYISSLADSTPLAAVTRSLAQIQEYQYPILDYSWTAISLMPRNLFPDSCGSDATRVHFYGKRVLGLLAGCP